MVVQTLLFDVHPDNDPELRVLFDRLAPACQAAKGCRQISFFGDARAGEYGALSIWESREDVEAFSQSAPFQAFLDRLQPFLHAAPVAKLYDHYQPRSVPPRC